MYGYTRNKEGEVTGEIDRLRYSAFDCWTKSKDSYRKRYYEGQNFQTRETVFGHEGHKKIEQGEVVLPGLPTYDKHEYDIAVTLGRGKEAIKIGGCLDAFDPETCSFLDYKFSHRNKDGKAPWDAVKVARHTQLVFYSLLVKKKHGKVNPLTRLIWVETEFASTGHTYRGHTFGGEGRELRLTGEFEPFERVVKEWERKLLVGKIRTAAKEIQEDFKRYKEAQI